MRSLAQVEPSGQADLAATFERLSRRIAPRSICILISDLMEEPCRVAVLAGTAVQAWRGRTNTAHP